MGTHYAAGSTVYLTYWSAGSISVNGTATTENRWTSSDYFINNTNTTYTIGTSGNTITLTPSSGNVQSITAPYATTAGSASSVAWSNVTDKPTLGTAAAKDVAASGNASSTQVVMGNDTRLTNSRPASNTVDTYSSTGTDPVSGKGVAAALATLDGTVSGSPGAGKTLTAFSETDGKVSATFGNISITKSQVSDFPSLGTASGKNYTTSVTSGSADLVTSGAVYSAIDALPEPMVFKGSLGTNGTITALPVNGSATIGDTYKVITAGTYASKAAKVGDTFICLTKTSSANTWELIPSGDEPSGTVTSVGLQNATNGGLTVTGSPITTSGAITVGHTNVITAGTAKGDDSKTLTFGGTFTVPSVTYDVNGHITSKGTTTMTMPGNPNTDTKVRQTLNSDNTNRPLLMSQAATSSTTGNVDNISYRNNSIYANASTGSITATQFNGKLVGDISGGTGLTSSQVTTALTYTPANNSSTVSTVAYDTTNKKFTKTINGTTSDVAKLATTSVGSASAGTAIAADDITAWTTNTPTEVTPNTVVTGGTTTAIPNISKKTVVTGVTKKTVVTACTPATVVTSASGATASVSGCTLTLTNGSFSTGAAASVSTGDSCTVTTGDSVTVGTAINAYTSLTTGDACTVTPGTAAELTYTAKSIPNISVSSKTVATGFTTS